jgi:hypothetical protein
LELDYDIWQGITASFDGITPCLSHIVQHPMKLPNMTSVRILSPMTAI